MYEEEVLRQNGGGERGDCNIIGNFQWLLMQITAQQ